MITSVRHAPGALSLAFALTATLGLAPTHVARASTHDGAQQSIRVSFRDLNLESDAGVTRLYVRIRDAARSVCGGVDRALPEEKAAWDQCVDEAIAGAVTQVGSARLTAHYLARTPGGHFVATAQISAPAARTR